MFNPTLTLINNIIEATNNGDLNWNTKEDFSCADCVFNDNQYIICKYLNENDEFEISFNRMNEFGFIEGLFREFKENHPLYDSLNQLYNVIKPNNHNIQLDLPLQQA